MPLYGIDQDALALGRWREVMPGYQVIGFEHDSASHPWYSFDALHCRTRAIWDPGMLYLAHQRIDRQIAAAPSYPLTARIIDYSGSGLVAGQVAVQWRRAGEGSWRAVPLAAEATAGSHVAAIPAGTEPGIVEYYLEAADHSGRHESLPPTAPAGHYAFTIVGR